MTDITVPELGESVSEATVGRWLKAAGEQVARDDVLVELETDKVAIEVAASENGILAEIICEQGHNVEIGAVLGRIGQGDASTPSPEIHDAPASDQPAADQPPPHTLSHPSSQSPPAIAPSVRRIAGVAGIDPATIVGSGRDGRATKADAMAHVARAGSQASGHQTDSSAPSTSSPAPAPPPASSPAPAVPPHHSPDRHEERVRMSRLRQTIARRLKEAQNTAAMLSTFNDIDMSNVMELRKNWRETFLATHGVKLGFMGFFTRACIDALGKFPAVNARIDGDDIVYHHYCDISIAVGTDRGLVTPVIRNAQLLDLAGIEREIARLGALARDGQIQLDDIRGGTFTITNGGVYGSMLSTPIVNPPQAAVLGIHRIEERPVAIDGQITVRPMMYLALSYDHRIIDGKEAVSFLVAIKDSMENPERMLLGI